MSKEKAAAEYKPTRFEDSIIVGILGAIKDNEVPRHKIVPIPDDQRHVTYDVYGDVERSLQEIYQNKLFVSALDAINGIKATRQMIFTLRRGGCPK